MKAFRHVILIIVMFKRYLIINDKSLPINNDDRSHGY